MLKYFIFFSFLLVINLSITILYDSNAYVSLINGLLKKSNKKLWKISERNLASISSKLTTENNDPLPHRLTIDEEISQAKRLKNVITKNPLYMYAEEFVKLEFSVLKEIVNNRFTLNANLENMMIRAEIELVFYEIYKYNTMHLSEREKQCMINRICYRVNKFEGHVMTIEKLELALKIYKSEYLVVIRTILKILLDLKNKDEISFIYNGNEVSRIIFVTRKLMNINLNGIKFETKYKHYLVEYIVQPIIESTIAYISKF